MKRATMFALGLGVAVAVLLGLFLLPVVPISVEFTCFGPAAGCSLMSYSASASVTYAYLGVGAVYISSNSAGHSYCWMVGNPGTMCGNMMQRK